MVAFLNIYSQYCANYKKGIDHCTYCTAEQHPLSNGLQLKDYLIKPVQQLCKYPLLFRELLKYTPQDHPDYPGVQATFAKVEEVSSNINNNAEKESMEKLVDFNANVEGFEDFNHFVYGHRATNG